MTTRQLPNYRPNIRLIYDTRIISPKEDQQIFRTAFIYSACILFVIICGACALLVYHILEPFFQSILWSILVGAFLFPFKNRLTLIARNQLIQLDNNSHLLIYGLILILPLKILDQTIESIGPLCIRKWKELILIFIFLPSIEFIQSGVVYRCLIIIGYDYFVRFERYIHIFDSFWILSFIIIYFFAILIVYNNSSIIKSLLNIFSIPIWFILFIYLSQYLSIYYRFIGVNLIGILVVLAWIIDQNVNVSDQDSIFTNFFNIFRCLQIYFPTKSVSSTIFSSSSSTTLYLTFLIWSLIAIKVYEFCWYLIPISIFIIIYKIIKYFLSYTYTYLSRQTRIIDYLSIRHEVLIPFPLHLIIRCIRKGDKKINHYLQESIDYLISGFLILTLFILIIFGTILLLIQIEHESIHMIKLTSHFVNQTILFQEILPDKEYIRHLMEKFYVFGRSWITIQVAKVQPPPVERQCCLPLSVHPNESPYMHINTLGEGSLSNKNLEEQVLQLWDRLYTYLTNTSLLFISHKNRSRILYTSSNQNLFTDLQTNVDFHINDIYHLIRDNLDLFRIILDSIWSNTTLILTLLSTILSLLFTGGFALVNFFLSFIVFITLLFYLLSNSNQPIYRPTIWLNNILAIGGSGLGKAVNDVVTSVFIASLKIATFYGLYTYVLHTLLGSNLIFLPAVIAAICAITLKSYWAALPGCLDLWLVQQRPLSALILLIAQILPVYIVDTAIYSEVKGGGHQYLTALSIAGGVYYRGIEGALFGPIILCCLLVGIRMYNETLFQSFD